MMRPKWSIWVLKLFWVVGLLGLLFMSYHLEQSLQQKASETYHILPLFWFYSTAPFLLGVYLSLLFVKKWLFRMNKPLFLCVTVPCLIISFYLPTVTTFFSNLTFLPNVLWPLELSIFGIIPMVAGLTLIVGLFEVTQPSKNWSWYWTGDFAQQRFQKQSHEIRACYDWTFFITGSLYLLCNRLLVEGVAFWSYRLDLH